MRRLLPLLFLCLLSAPAFAQFIVAGKVIDSLSQEPIAFANVTLKDGRSGTTTDIEGNFKLNVPPGYAGPFYFTHVSYKKYTGSLSAGYYRIQLEPRANLLREVTFVAEENPAWPIIRKAIAAKDANSPKSLTSYQYIAYNKFLVTTGEPDRKTDSLIDLLLHRPDTTALTKIEENTLHFDSLADRSHLFLSESVTEKKVINPEKEKERLLALRVSGYKSPLFTNVATDYQPFSFYDDVISLLGKDYVNPVSKGTFGRYDFYLVDTTYYQADTVYIVEYEPQPGKNFNGLSGMISISTEGFAIKNVIASTSDPTALTGIRIQQNYERIQGHWFPVELNTDLDLHEYSLYGRGIKAQHRSFIREVHINPPLDRREFGDIEVDLSPPAKDENERLMSLYQVNPLNGKEKNTYRVMDSVMRKIGWLDKGLEALASRALPVGPLDIDLTKIVTFNRYENTRLGIGLLTNDRFSKVIRLGGYYGYGFSDQQSKYGGELKFLFNQNKDFFVRFSARHDIYETGSSHIIRDGQLLGNEAFRIWNASRFDKINSYKAELGYRILQDVHAVVSLDNEMITPDYNYMLTLNGEASGSFEITEATLALRYVRDENYMNLRGRKIFLSQQFPVITLSFGKAVDLFGAGDFHYSRVDFSLKHQIKHRALGKTKLYVSAGWIDGLAPYGQLYNGRGSRSASFVTDTYFQTMGLYEFTVSRFSSLFVQHNFGNVLVNKSFSKPELLIYQNIGVGSLSDREAHQGVKIESMDKGFVESGLGVINLLRFRYIRIGYLGLGASVFYRYGPYRLPNQQENFAYRLNISFSL